MSGSGPTSDKRILFVYDRVLASFMARDWDIVSRKWPRSRLFCWRGWRDVLRLAHAVLHADLILCWFGTSHALVAALANAGRRPLVIVAGGWDVAKLPDIHYGAHAAFPQAPLSRLLFAKATRVLAVSEFTAHEAHIHAGVPEDRIQVIFHGFDPSAWAESNGRRELDVVTANGGHAMVKGIDLLIDTAARMPDVRFEVIGPVPGPELNSYMQALPDNLTFSGPVFGDDFRAKLCSASVYFQPSRQESFGCAVAEAMLCGCIPVLTRRGALEEVAGDTGFYVDRMLPQEMEKALRSALAAPESKRLEVRQRIVNTYHIKDHKARLTQNLTEMLA